MFYTYYRQWGNNILFSYIEDDKLVHSKVSTYKPTLYLKSEEETGIKSIYGHDVKSVNFDDIKAAKSFIDQYKDVDGMTVEGNTKFANQFVIELCEGETPEFDDSLIRGAILDIEVTASSFPEPSEAKYAVDLLTIYDTLTQKFTVLSLYDYDQNVDESAAKDLDVTHKKFDTETELLLEFVNFFADHKYSFTSGWNSSGFDMPYLVTRITNVLGKSVVNRLSPYGIVNTRMTEDQFYNKVLTVEIVGLPDIDYMLLYKKHIYEPRENYKLGYIGEVELGDTKLSYEEEGSLFNLSRTNPQKYTSYNIIDVDLIRRLEEKLGLFPLTFTLAYYCLANYEDTLGTVGQWESLVAKELYNRGMVPPARQSSNFRNYPGGYVAEPQRGFHDWIFTLDLNSLYPHIEMQVNISPETHIPRKDLPRELQDLQDKLAVRDVDNYFNQCMPLVMKEVDLSVLKKYNYSMAANGQFYRRDIKGILPAINEDLYKNRKVYQKKMRESKQILVDIEHEMKLRGMKV